MSKEYNTESKEKQVFMPVPMANGHIEFTLSMCIYVCVCADVFVLPKSCPVHNFVIPQWILKLLGRNVYYHETMCPVQVLSL